MIVNLAVDHLMSTPPASAEEVWNATHEHSRVYTDAAQRIGLTPAEYTEFRRRLLDGQAVYVKMPHRIDAMAGNHRGHVYAVHNAVITTPVMGWKVNLSDGNTVYVPQTCGNLSLQHHAVVAHVAVPRGRARFTPAVATVPRVETPVAMVAPAAPETPVADVPVAAPAAAPAAVAAAPATASGRFSPFLLFIPAAIGGAIAGFTHHGTSPVPACSAGSNASGVCAK